MYSYDHSQLYLKKEIDELEFELKEFDRMEMQFNQKANRLQYQVDSMEAKLENLGCDILHVEMVVSHLKNEFRYAKTNEIIDSLRYRLDAQGYHLQNLKESKEYLAMDIHDKLREIDSVTLDFIDDLERNLDGKISFFRYYYPTIMRSMLITCLIGFIASYLYHAVGVSIELRLGGDDDEEEGGEDGEKEEAD
ncbi:predicted protein [Naegleria gruberi]|uniref:Predicted protein n=1 Tax=Naegleria gruberi TaxID=5762 RepID=D2W1F0_NAEGR|nr:uncharacterized protein NAEGRDRAFT_75193 [Naegleria gruberi]EFC37076.1 predicted protein [Naegleria gruberi]|eukprot:XP_002669820.1 predicted protein [Naegleria gruberi strain NEG-M]